MPTTSQNVELEKIKNEKLGIKSCLYSEFLDIKTGTGSQEGKKYREGLNNAIVACRAAMNIGDEAILVIAKLDRLSRNLHFITSLQQSNIKFVCCDMPNANESTIHIFGTIAQLEAEMISTRTKEALQAKKRLNPDGFIDRHGNFRKGLGNPQNLTKEAMIKGNEANRRKSIENPDNIKSRNYALVLYKSGLSYSSVAKKLNNDGFRTSTGYQFSAMQVQRLVKPLLVTD